MILDKISPPETLADIAYREIKQAIIQSKFLPGGLLPEEALASSLGISRTPLRKAIARLAFDGLVELENGKVARVAVISEKDLEHFASLRMLLEVFAAEQAVLLIDDDGIQELKELMVAQKKTIMNKDWNDFISLDFEFHVTIAKITQNQKLEEFIEQVNNNLHRYLILTGSLEESSHEAYLEHIEIIQSFEERDARKAKESMTKHMQNIQMRFRSKSQTLTQALPR